MKNRNRQAWSIPALLALYPIATSIIVASVTYSLVMVFNLRSFLLPHVVAVCILASVLPFASAYIHKTVDTLKPIINEFTEDDEININRFFDTYYWKLYSNWTAYLLPVVFTAICLQSIINLGTPWQGVAAKAYNILITILLLIASGVGWHFLNFLLFLRGVSQLQIKGEPFIWNKTLFRKLSRTYFDIFVIGVFAYIGAILTVWLIPWGQLILFSTAFGYLWAFPLAGIVITYFILSQYFIHAIMRSSKEKRIEKIDSQLEQAYTKWLKKPSTDKAAIMSELINWRKIVSEESDWPINIQANVAVIGGILAPAIGIVFELLANRK